MINLNIVITDTWDAERVRKDVAAFAAEVRQEKATARRATYLIWVDLHSSFPNVATVWWPEPNRQDSAKRLEVRAVVRARGHAGHLAEKLISEGYTGENSVVLLKSICPTAAKLLERHGFRVLRF